MHVCGDLRKIAVFHFNVGLLYARMALLCVSFREDNAAVATMAWRFSREVTMAQSRQARIFDPDLRSKP